MHHPVLLEESINFLCLSENGLYIDGTFGRGGHSTALLARLGPDARLCVVDKDPDAIAYAKALYQKDPRVLIQQGSFANLSAILEKTGWDAISGILLDLGCSSPQLDEAHRGFSFQQDGPLDMRMDPHNNVSAAEWLARVDEKTLAEVLKRYGEERQARTIAKRIIMTRSSSPIQTTFDLVGIVESVLGRKRFGKKHPATRTFQAIRMYINQELEELHRFLGAIPAYLAPGGRLGIITFHSLEDRCVKNAFKVVTTAYRDPVAAALLRDEEQGGDVDFRLHRKIKASDEEIAQNPRARSAMFRGLERKKC
jgi:16S rRNA (cytosine1402-N4)-methyltransferase